MKPSAFDERKACWRVALGREPADLVIQAGRVVDLHSAEVYSADIAVRGRRIAAIGDVGYTIGPATRIYNVAGKFLTPTFIEGHMHASGCLTSLTELAKVLVAHGTTVICTDLYEAAVSGGLVGMRQCVEELNRTPLRVLLTVGYQMYLQNQQFGHTGKISGDDMLACYAWPETIGISEWIYHMVDRDDPYMQELFRRLYTDGKLFVGHANSYSIEAVQAYACVGAYSDHESGTAEDALQKIRRGYKIMIRQYGNEDGAMRRILKLVTEKQISSRYISFSTDHDSPSSLKTKGHLDEQIRIAIRLGVTPIDAIRMASLNNAEYFGIQADHGSLAPGKLADICVVDALDDAFSIAAVFASGELAAERYRFIGSPPRTDYPPWWRQTMNVGRRIAPEDVIVTAPSREREARVRIIGYAQPPGTESREAVLRSAGGALEPDVGRDILKIVVFDRHHASGRIGKGFIQGIGLRDGAVGSSWTLGVADITVVGTNDHDIAVVANEIMDLGGGIVVAQRGRVVHRVELPLLGVMSADPIDKLSEKLRRLDEFVHVELGGIKEVWHPLALVSMPRAIPSLKICCHGLVDVGPGHAEAVELFVR